MSKTAKDYLREPYSRTLIPVGDGTYFAEIAEFRGCFAEGQTPNEAYTNLERVAESWIDAALSQGQEIPKPFATYDFSGRISLRIPRSIHKQAAKFAEMDDTSLNQFILSAISGRVGAEEFFEHLLSKLEDKLMTTVTTVSLYTVPFKFEGSVQLGTQVFQNHSIICQSGPDWAANAEICQTLTPELPAQVDLRGLQISSGLTIEKEALDG
ncbi:MAG: type II toxin-antitoxin system HicB family antitoxin [Thermodesulfobacteriota bacterium]